MVMFSKSTDQQQSRQKDPSVTKLLWMFSLIISLTLVMLILVIWYKVDVNYNPNPNQMVSASSAEAELEIKLKEAQLGPEFMTERILTGVYIQSLNFTTSNDVFLSGYIWQTFPKDKKIESPNFFFPEQVNSNFIPVLKYKKEQGKNTVYNWYFEATVRQEFDYSKYPLDHKTVWLKILPENYDNKVILLPDLISYASTSPETTFGIDKTIVLSGWDINETYFNYKMNHYDTNFGISDQKVVSNRPELYFSIVLKRKVLNAFIIHLIPMLTVASLLFAVQITTTQNTKIREINGFNIIGVLDNISALFFSVVIFHVNFRLNFAAHGIVYIEYFYFVMYFMMILVMINAFIHKNTGRWYSGFFHSDDNLWPKLFYWPCILGAIALATYLQLL
ncbi:MAG: hypothetical protein JKX94_08800 [Sneathiella sp.]|nr:hypothetical protein [Sneathiella sp.]